MKVLFIQPYLGFAGVVSGTLAGHLARKGYEVDVVSYVRDKRNIPIFLHHSDIKFHFVNAFSISIPTFVAEFPYFIFLENIVRNIDPDIIHINNLPFLTTYQSVQIAKKLGKKSIVHVHGVLGEKGPFFNIAQKVYILTFGNYIFNNADEIICLTNKDAEMIQKYGSPLEKIHVIPNGVDVNQFNPFGDEIPYLLLWCGRFVQEKGLFYLVEALKLIARKKKYPIKLILIGDGPLLSSINKIVKKYNLSENVIFIGGIPHKKVRKIINKASIFLLPSVKEGMPYVLLEAMACGKPVIGSDISGINNVITDNKNGLLIPPRDSEALANAIIRLIEDRELKQRLGKSARQLMVEKYDWSMIVKKIERVYYQSLNK